MKRALQGRYLKIATAGESFKAFVPAPLPPRPAIEWSPALRSRFDAALLALGRLDAVTDLLPNAALLLYSFVRKEAVLSSMIEGTQSSLADLMLFELDEQPGVPLDDAREVSRYVAALEHGLERVRGGFPLSLRLIRDVHERLMQGVRGGAARPGEFRGVQNWIGRYGTTLRDADYVPPPPPEMLQALDALEGYLQSFTDEHPPLVRLAFIHYQFEAIHPFLDGNGRMGRLLIGLLLRSWELLPLPLLYLSAYFERHRSTYYDLLLAVSQRAAWREWVLFFLNGVLEQARDASDRARRLNDLRAAWHDRLTDLRAAAHALKLADSLFVSPLLNIPQAQKLLDASYPTAQRSIEKLVEAGILQQAGEQNYGKTYAARDILAVVGEPLEVGDVWRAA
jgi:Fic family protein